MSVGSLQRAGLPELVSQQRGGEKRGERRGRAGGEAGPVARRRMPDGSRWRCWLVECCQGALGRPRRGRAWALLRKRIVGNRGWRSK